SLFPCTTLFRSWRPVMEISSSALTGALRVGVKVVVGRKRPVLEIYQQLHNVFGPPCEIGQKDAAGRTAHIHTHRSQDIFIDLTLINIGGDRAESVTFEVSGEFRREEPRHDLPQVLNTTIDQVALGQALYVMRIADHDLNRHKPDNTEHPTSYKPEGFKDCSLNITIHYHGPSTFLNKSMRWPRRCRGLKQYS